MKGLQAGVGLANGIAQAVMIVVYAALVTAIFTAVVFRYALNDSLVWAEELARWLFVWLVFVGAGVGVRRRVHVGVDVLTARLAGRHRRRLRVVVNLGLAGFLVALVVYGVKLAAFAMSQSSPVIGLPMGYVYAALPVGGAVMLINVVEDLLGAAAGDGG